MILTMSEIENKRKMAEEKDKILRYLKAQLQIKIDALAAMEEPIDKEALKDLRKLEEMMLKREVYELNRHIQVIESMV